MTAWGWWDEITSKILCQTTDNCFFFAKSLLVSMVRLYYTLYSEDVYHCMGSSDLVFVRTNRGMHHFFSVTVRGRYSADIWRANRQCHHQLFIMWNPKILSVRLYGPTDQCNNEERRCLRSHCDSFQSDLAGDQGKRSRAVVKKMKPLWETEGGPRTDGCLICEWAMQPFAVRCSLSKTGQRRLEFGPFLHWQNVFKQRKWIHISHDNRRTITDSGISALLRLTRRTTSATILWSNVSLFLSPLHDTARLVNSLIYGGLSIALTGRLWLAEDNWKDIWLLMATTHVFTHKYRHE